MRFTVALTIAVAALFSTATARAAVVYERGLSKVSVWIANDDGSGARKLVSGGQEPHLAPDGSAVVYIAHADRNDTELREIPATGGHSKLLLKPIRYGAFAWSPDSRYIAAQSGSLNGRQKLVLIDRTNGASRTVATGYFYGASFSPASDQLVYSRTAHDTLFPAANLEIALTSGGVPRVLTQDGRALYPVWGPQRIVFVRYQHPARHGDGPKFNLWLIAPDGTGLGRLTHDKVPFLLAGLTPVAWSADGTRLVTNFGGQDTNYVVTVDPATGAERVIGSKSQGFVATGLSRDGSTILGSSGGAVFSGPSRVVTAPYSGGATHVLIPRGQAPDWNR